MKELGCYISMIAMLFLVGCSEGKDEPAITQPTDKGQQEVQQEEPIPAEGDPIVFTASINDGEADTRALLFNHNIVYGITDFTDGIEDEDDLEEKGFGVYAYYTIDKMIGDPDFSFKNKDQYYKEIVMLNQKVENKDGKWTYSPPRFWPGSQNYMSFFAYAPWDTDNHPYIGVEGTNYELRSWKNGGYWAFKYNSDIIIPQKKDPWLFEEQKDIVWGMNATTGLPYKNVRRPDTKTASTPEGTLGWEFKHAFARVKFSIFNFKDLFENPSMIIADETPVKNKEKDPPDDDEGLVGKNGEVERYTYTPDPTKPNKKEYYIRLREDIESPNLCHKFEDIGDNSAILIITGVTFKNVVKSANFSYDNTTPFEPGWTINEVYGEGGYNIPPSLLNSTIYMDNTTLSDLPSDYDYATLPGLRTSTTTLTKASGAGMDDKIHYFLFIPTQEYMNFVHDDQAYLKITIKYKIVRGYKLTGYYTWIDENTLPTQLPGDFTMIGIQGQKALEQTSTFEVPVSFEANKSYHVAMRLGKMLQVLFEVTDWDIPESITVNIPSFE